MIDTNQLRGLARRITRSVDPVVMTVADRELASMAPDLLDAYLELDDHHLEVEAKVVDLIEPIGGMAEEIERRLEELADPALSDEAWTEVYSEILAEAKAISEAIKAAGKVEGFQQF
jgi:hypothetical protein